MSPLKDNLPLQRLQVTKWNQANGMDAGIEQQISMLIETIGKTIKDFDWNELQKIDLLIENQI